MKNKLLHISFLIGFFSFILHEGQAQNQNNWINYNQTYYKIKIGEDGIYRINRNALITAGIPATSIDPRRLQLFHNGVEQAIHVEGQADGVFDASDYIEFFGKRNDGTDETSLYRAADAQPHTYHSLFSDSSAYFLTWHLTNQSGKRRSTYTENNVTNIAPDAFHRHEQLRLFTSQYHAGRAYPPNNEIQISIYDYSEGWTGNAFTRGNSSEVVIQNLTGSVASAGVPQIEVMLAGRNNNPHQAEVRVGPTNNSLRQIGSIEWNRDEIVKFSRGLQWSDFSPNGTMVVRTTAVGVANAADRMSVSYIKVTYPRAFDMQNAPSQVFRLNTNSGGRSYISVANPTAGVRLYDISDPNNIIQIGINTPQGSFNAIVRNTNSPRKLLATSDFKPVTQLTPVTFTRPVTEANYLIVSHPSLRTGAGVTADPVQAYANYRSSAQGGGFNVAQLDIHEVYDQFGFGIPTPVAIRNYVAHYLANGGNPRYLFLIGKGVSVNFNFYRQNPNTTQLVNFVPTYGYPGGDEPFTAGLGGEQYVAAVPTGRLNARNAKQVQDYLNKVVEMEALPYDALWRKDMLHLSGGTTTSEQVLFKRYVEEFEAIAVEPYLGAEVVTQSKRTTDAVEFLNVTGEVNEGKALITFFGHSGTTATDIDIGFVSEPSFGYSNKGRYPVILVNGCNAGDLYSTVIGFGEDWVNAGDAGALGFMAHSKLAFPSTLRRYSNLFYTIAFQNESFFGESLGLIRQELARRYFNQFGLGEASISQIEQVVLLGDPAIKVFGATLPDYAIEALDIEAYTFDGSVITSSADSFLLKIPVLNFGKFPKDSVEVKVTRTLSDGTIIDYPIRSFPAIGREGFWEFVITNDPENFNNGLNSFQIVIDPQNKIEELEKSNNTATSEIFIAAGSTTNLFPVNFGTVNSKNVQLIVQSTNILSGMRSYTVEIDTTRNFNSPFARSAPKQADGIASFDFDISAVSDSTVIYWRSKFTNPTPEESALPVVSSFAYIPAMNEGWTIRHEDQYQSLMLDGIVRDPLLRQWRFEEVEGTISLVTHGAQTPGRDQSDIQLFYNELSYITRASDLDQGCRNNTVNMVGFDRESTVPYKVLEFPQFDVLNPLVCGRVPQVIFNFVANDIFNPSQANGGNRRFNQFIDAAKTDDYVLIFTMGTVNFENFDNQVKNALTEIGVAPSEIPNLRNGRPFIIFGRKGAAAGTAMVIRDNNSGLPPEQQVLVIDETLRGVRNSGTITSPLIGPAKAWGTLLSNINSPDQLTIAGVDTQGQETELLSIPVRKELNLSFIDPANYPFLKLKLTVPENENRPIPVFDSWLLKYQTPPEGVLLKRNPEPIRIQEGVAATTDFTYWNIGNTPYTDSLNVNINLRNVNTRAIIEQKLSLNPPSPGDSIVFNVPLATEGNLGLNTLAMVALPKSGGELYPANNQLNIPEFLEVVIDDRNPILDVAFDGMYILDGDIVSPNPRITILIRDDNPILKKTDTTGVNIWLKKPCESCGFERIALSGPKVNWEPATENRDFSIEFMPGELEDGMYGLRVQVTDASGNPSGSQPYEINFEVINESTITHFYPYPNPFSTSTRFVFTLTGAVVPDEIKIQIMTVTGRVVREILQDEIGPIRIGNNITEYAWDGRDEFGDPLANGVYLYRVILRQGGQAIDHRTTVADKAFKKGFGKMYILR